MESTQWLSNNEGMVDGWYGSGMASLIVLTIQKRLLVLAGVFGGWATGKFTSENQPGLLTNLSLRPSLNQLSEWCLLRALLDECLVGRQHYFSCSGRAGLITLLFGIYFWGSTLSFDYAVSSLYTYYCYYLGPLPSDNIDWMKESSDNVEVIHIPIPWKFYTTHRSEKNYMSYPGIDGPTTRLNPS